MSAKGLYVLEQLVEKEFTAIISDVIIGKDKHVADDCSDAIKAVCNAHGIKLANRTHASKLPSSHTYAIAISWRWLIKEQDAKLIVMHDSLLPKYRGFAPLVNALIAGETTIGVSAIYAASTYDTGDIIKQDSTDITYPITIQDAIAAIQPCYASLAIDICSLLSNGDALPGTAQEHTKASYSIWRDEKDYKIDWTQVADTITRFVDAVGSPYAGATCYLEERLVRVVKVSTVADVDLVLRHVGKVIWMDEGLPVVVCGKGLIRIEQLEDLKTGKTLLPLKKFRTRFE